MNTAASIKTAQETVDSFQNATRAGLNRISRALYSIENTVSNYEAAKANLIDIANSSTQELLHEVVAENVNSVLSSTDNVSDALAKFSGLSKLSKAEQAAFVAGVGLQILQAKKEESEE